MPLKSFIKLHFIIALPLLILGGVLLIMNQPSARAAGREFQVQTLSCNNPLFTLPITPADQYYGKVIPLLENQGDSTVALQSAYAGIPNVLEKSLDEFSILKEGDTYYLWIANKLKAGQSSPINTIEQRLESKNGLVWCNRTNTNLARTDTYKYSLGPRTILKNGGMYEGWDEYYYEWSVGWGYAVRYITSTNGITWTVANEPALIGTENITVIKEGNTYRMWAEPHGDNSYQGSRSLRYRTSTNGGTGWGNWQTGGTLVSLDGQETGNGFSRVRRLADGTHQLFYLRNNAIHLATSTNGITFTTQISNFLNLTKTLPITGVSSVLWDFAVVDVGGEDWVYLSYCKATSTIGRCIDSYMGVARPTQNADLALTKTVTPEVVHAGDTITYTLTFSNTGPNTASGVVITDILPSALENAVVNSNITITDSGYYPAYVWQVANLPAGAKGVITITAKVKSSLTVSNPPPTNRFTNTATIATTVIETDKSNNSAAAESIVTEATSPSSSSIFLPTLFAKPVTTFPIFIGNAIKARSANPKGEIFYNQVVEIPNQLPTGGNFYFSAQSDKSVNVLVDDKIIVLLDGIEILSHNFSQSGSPVPTTLKIPQSVMVQIAGKTIKVQYHDVYGSSIEASTMWLIWTP